MCERAFTVSNCEVFKKLISWKADIPRGVHHAETAEVAAGQSHQDGTGAVDVVAEPDRH